MQDKTRNTLRVPALAALALTGLALAAPAAHADSVSARADAFLAPSLAARHAAGWSAVILKIDGDLTPSQEARLRALGADVTRHLPLIGSVSARVPARNLRKIAALPFVARLSSDLMVRKCDEFTCASSKADAAYTQYGLTGQGVTVAVVDSGVMPYADLSKDQNNSRVVSGPSFVPGDPSTADACGHGTHVAGIVAGNAFYSSLSYCTHSYYGIARAAGILGVRVLDKSGQGSVSTVVSGIQWVVKNKAAYNVRVLNLSLGHPVGESYKTDPLCQAVEAAWKAGIVVVCAAGNNGRVSVVSLPGVSNEGWGTAYGSVTSPGNDPSVITVGATKSVDAVRAHDRIATYSGRGPSRLDLVLKPDIIAPGNKVISLGTSYSYLYSGFPGNQIPLSTYMPTAPGGTNQAGSQNVMSAMTSATYYRLSGTSMAAPVVAGAAALLLQASPNLTPDTVKARLMISADKWADPQGNADPLTYGAGYLNIPAALASTAVATLPALSPALTEDGAGNVFLNASQITSASHVIWGSAGLTDMHVIWGSNAITGSGLLTDSHVIWGSSVFSDHVIWGTTTSAVDLSSTAINGE